MSNNTVFKSIVRLSDDLIGVNLMLKDFNPFCDINSQLWTLKEIRLDNLNKPWAKLVNGNDNLTLREDELINDWLIED